MAYQKKTQETESPLEVTENPIVNTVEQEAMVEKPKSKGKWFKVTLEELSDLESKGVLLGYDPITSEAIIK